MSPRNKQSLRLVLSLIVGLFIAYTVLHAFTISDAAVDRLFHVIMLPLAIVGTYCLAGLLPFLKADE